MPRLRKAGCQQFDLLQNHAADVSRQVRQARTRILDHLRQPRDISDPFRRHMPEFIEVRAKGVDRFGPLLHDLLAGAKRHRPGLLGFGLGFDEPHGRTHRCLNDCFRVGGVVFLALDERFDVMRRNEPDAVPVGGQFPRPMVRAGTRLHRHVACGMVRHESRKLQSRQLLAENNHPIRCRPVQLEHVLCQIDPDNANFFHGCPLLQLVLRHHEYGTSRCRQGESGIHPISTLRD